MLSLKKLLETTEAKNYDPDDNDIDHATFEKEKSNTMNRKSFKRMLVTTLVDAQ